MMTDEPYEKLVQERYAKLIEEQLKLTKQFNEILTLLKLDLINRINRDKHHDVQSQQNVYLRDMLSYGGDK